jgi:DNA repair photolyase
MLTTTRKSLLYKTGVEYGDYTANHIEGCAHGCKYPCYAMLMARRFGRAASYEDWTQPKLVSNALDLLDRELPRFCTATQRSMR